MNPKSLIWIGCAIGSAAGSYLPLLWGAGLVSVSSVFWGTVGGVVGIILGFKLSKVL